MRAAGLTSLRVSGGLSNPLIPSGFGRIRPLTGGKLNIEGNCDRYDDSPFGGFKKIYRYRYAKFISKSVESVNIDAYC